MDNTDAKNKALVFIREDFSDKANKNEEFEILKENILDKITRRNILEYKVNKLLDLIWTKKEYNGIFLRGSLNMIKILKMIIII